MASESTTTGFVCDICGKSFKTALALGGHKRFVHQKNQSVAAMTDPIEPEPIKTQESTPAVPQKRRGRPKMSLAAIVNAVKPAAKRRRRHRRTKAEMQAMSNVKATPAMPTVNKTSTSNSNMNFCFNCGTRLVPMAVYCQNCGTKMPKL